MIPDNNQEKSPEAFGRSRRCSMRMCCSTVNKDGDDMKGFSEAATQGPAVSMIPARPDSSEGATEKFIVASSERKQRVLILCTGNSCRSQLAEALWRYEAGARWDCFSAGTDPKGIHPRTGSVLKELSISLDGQRSKHLREFAGQSFDLVITVCDHAQAVCPVFPGAARQEHWPFDDPATAKGSDEEVMAVFRRVRDKIRERIREYVNQ
jgi:arsenate reductase